METAVKAFLEYGALGVLAMAFLAQLILFVRSDKRAQRYAELLTEAQFDRGQLIQVIVENTRAATALGAIIGEQTKTNERTAAVITKLDARLEADERAFLQGRPKGR